MSEQPQPHIWKPYFPYPTVREEQRKAIDFAIENFVDKNKRYVIVEGGTGVGKSAIGLATARYITENTKNNNESLFASAAYYLTTQKILQEQYMKDFKSKGMLSLKSSSNYRCKYYKTKTCQESRRELKASADDRFKAACASACHYVSDKNKFINGYHGVTNFPYFLTEINHSGHLPPRKIMIIDECHNVELEMSKFVEVSFTVQFAKSVLKLKVPDLTTQFKVYSWIKSEYMPKLTAVRSQMAKTLEQTGLKSRLAEFVALERKWSMIESHWTKISRFLELYDKDNWIMNIDNSRGAKGKKFEFKPIDIAPYTEEFLFKRADKILMMSATIMNRSAFCRVLGLEESEVAFISIPSPFDVNNRPIIATPVASMNARDIDSNLPKLAAAVQAILEAHPEDKGVIHAHSYKIANYLRDNVKTKRLLSHDSFNRDKVLARHQTDPRPTVLLSPSMSEGVDLKGDTSRFQILCKIPYPYLGDKLVKKRMHKWKWWYSLQTAKTIVQSVGRSIRNEEDHAVTYILDAGWDYFFSRNKHVFPQDFKNCLK
jgi:ATP-dependent DNA helicase DinG